MLYDIDINKSTYSFCRPIKGIADISSKYVEPLLKRLETSSSITDTENEIGNDI